MVLITSDHVAFAQTNGKSRRMFIDMPSVVRTRIEHGEGFVLLHPAHDTTKLRSWERPFLSSLALSSSPVRRSFFAAGVDHAVITQRHHTADPPHMTYFIENK
jgi:hypothetical protein